MEQKQTACSSCITNTVPYLERLNSQLVYWMLISIGAILRIGQFVYNRSLTEGEAPLAMNILEQSYAGFFKPLNYVQAAPVGFLAVEKFLVTLFGPSEYALRLFPLASGVIALILFLWVAKRAISRAAVPVALLLFVAGDHLIYFSSEVKQYSSDVALSLLLILICLIVIQGNFKPRDILLFGMSGALCFWFSHPSLFTFSACAAVLVLWIIHWKNWKALPWVMCAFVLALASFITSYFAVLRAASQNAGLLNFWHHAFAPLPPRSLTELQWYLYVFLRMFKFPVGLSQYGLLLAIVAFFFGGFVLFKKCRAVFGILILPFLITLLASGLHLYPFEGRLILFIAPMLMLLIAEGITFIASKTSNSSRYIGIILIVLLLVYPVALTSYRLVKPRAPEELRPVLEYVDNNSHDRDVLYVYYAAYNAFRFYQPRTGYSNNFVVGSESRHDWSAYYKELQAFEHKERVWFLFSHIATTFGVDEEQLFVSYLDVLGERIDEFHAPGAAAYLYNFK